MQDFQPIPGLADRLFGSGGGALEHRRPRYPGSGGGQDPPAKCPRCDSTNTKFCYYNNYNLSQPRHFCKSCRRYWTKGGVLRNVPVGGGCRKSSSSSKRSSSSSKKSSKDRRKTAASSRSSSDSSSLTATEMASVSVSVSDPMFAATTDGSEFDPVPEADIFQESGTFTSLMMTAPPCVSFSDPMMPSVVEDARMPAMLGQTMTTDLGGGIDWPGAMDPSIFDLAGVDPAGAYWSHGQWGDTVPNLYIP